MSKYVLRAGIRTYVSLGLTYVAGVQYTDEKLGEVVNDIVDGAKVFEPVEDTDAPVVKAPVTTEPKPKVLKVGKGKSATVTSAGEMDTAGALLDAGETGGDAGDADAGASGNEGDTSGDEPTVTI